jgi:hypothetical protein
MTSPLTYILILRIQGRTDRSPYTKMVASIWPIITHVFQVGEFALANREDDVLTHRAKLSPSAFTELHRRHVDSVYRHILACVRDVTQGGAP